jgi:hypothetical protein
MTPEGHWLTGASPASLLYAAKRLKALKPRKAMLFVCGCYRLVWDEIALANVRETVQMAEERADRKVKQEELYKYQYVSGLRVRDAQNLLQLSLTSLVTPRMIPAHVAWLVRAAFDPTKHDNPNKWEDCKPQADLVRDLFGNPYQPVKIDTSWRTDTALSLARTMYENRDFSAMPILADALQDAGCDSEDILNHCRDSNATHVRGCWVVDLVLGKA